MVKVQLRFIGSDILMLQETLFKHPILPWEEQLAIRGRTAGAYHGYASFPWCNGVIALSLLLLEALIQQFHHGSSNFARPYLEGGAGSPAAALDSALSKETEWLTDMFGWDEVGTPILKKALIRTNPERKRPGPVSISLHPRIIPSSAIEIFLNNLQVVETENLEDMANRLRQQCVTKTEQSRARKNSMTMRKCA